MVNRACTGKFEGTAVFLFYTVPVITPAVTVHGKASFTGGNADLKEFGVFCIVWVKQNDAFSIIEFIDLIVNVFYIITFVSKESAFRNGQEVMSFSKDIEYNGAISDLGSGC